MYSSLWMTLVSSFLILEVDEQPAFAQDLDLPSAELNKLIANRWESTCILSVSEGPFVEEAVLITDADKPLSDLLSYPLHHTSNSTEGKPVLEDKLSDFCASLLEAHDCGDLLNALEEGKAGCSKWWVKTFGKSLKRKGEFLFTPLRVLLTGKRHCAEMSPSIVLHHKASQSGVVSHQAGFTSIEESF